MNSSKSFTFFIPGTPKPAGSKRVFPIRKGGQLTGKFIVTDASGKAGKDWRGDVRRAATDALTDYDFFKRYVNGPIALDVEFLMPRPKSHFTSKGALRPDAPMFHTNKPDTTKLVRSLEDAITGIVWEDDCTICGQRASKRYANPGEMTGATVTVTKVDDRPLEG